MGKIFKALEKSKNQTVATPSGFSEKNIGQVDSQKFEQVTRRSKDIKAELNTQKSAAEPVDNSDKMAAAPVYQEEKKQNPPIITNPAAESPMPQQPEISYAVKAPEKESLSFKESFDGTNDSMEREPFPKPAPTKRGTVEKKHEQREIENKNETARKADAIPRKAVNVNYSRTKIQANDPNILKNNKVLSIFEDMETSNQFKILRTQLLRKLKEIEGNSILITSANPCEGKTFTSINLGASIAKEFDKTVLIIDADIRRPLKNHTDFSTEFFSLNVEKGLADYLMGEADIEDILINPGIDKLTLIPGGVPVDNSPELLNSAKMEEMVIEIKNRYPEDRLVIIDGPAILPFPDAMILSRYVDGVLVVVESEGTSTEQVKKVMKHLQEVNILGVVLNKKRG